MSPRAYADQIAAAVAAIAIVSPDTISWLGRPVTLPAATERGRNRSQAARASLRPLLQQQLYSTFFLSGGVTSTREAAAPSYGAATRPFALALREANTGTGSWESGWVITGTSGDDVTLRRDGLELTAPRDAWRRPPGQWIEPGDQAQLRLPKDLPAYSPGFYLALGVEPFSRHDRQKIRLYWNVSPEGAIRLMERCTSLLNEERVPFHLKVCNDPGRFGRCDPAILYLRQDDVAAASDTLRWLYEAVSPWLRSRVPPLTKRLAPGLALAEDPGGESFGLHRCGLLADGVLRAWQAGVTDRDARLSVVLDELVEAGVQIDAPYLNPGSTGSYDVVLPSPDRPRAIAPDESAAFLRVAVEIGREIVDAAIWHEDRCAWLGVGTDGASLATLGPDLYGGTSGVALFLGELAAATGDDAARRTALGGIRHALARADATPRDDRLGLYDGRSGVAVAAARIARALDEPRLLDAARRLAHAIDPERSGPEPDLLGGKAGTICGLLILRRLLDEPVLLDVAARLGDGLLAAAGTEDAGCFWRSPGDEGGLPLTGFSHGASGIGFALLELAVATGEARFQRAAEAAFAWEQRWFDPVERNWADLRGVRARTRHAGQSLPYSAFWCHGAPGIALARLRAWHILGHQHLKDEATEALRTTWNALDAAMTDQNMGDGLCHGVAGNAEVLLHGKNLTGDTRASDVMRHVARMGAAFQARRESYEFASGWSPRTPGLMSGLAGVGLFYLRLTNHAAPSVLFPHQDAFAG